MSFPRRYNLMASFVPKSSSRELSGSAHLFLLFVLATLFVSGGCYLYSVNQSAVQGYHMRTLEKEIDSLKQENAELRIAEADLRSLSRIESTREELKMQKMETVRYLEGRGRAAANLGGSIASR